MIVKNIFDLVEFRRPGVPCSHLETHAKSNVSILSRFGATVEKLKLRQFDIKNEGQGHLLD